MMTSPASTRSGIGGFFEFDNTNTESCQVVIIGLVEIIHLGGLATDQGAPGLSAPFTDPLDNVIEHILVNFVDGDVIKEQQRLGPLHNQVIDIHRDEIDPDRVMLVHLDRQMHLGAHAVGACDEDRVFVVVLEELFVVIEPKEPGEPAGVVDHPLPVRSAQQRANRPDKLIARSDAHA